MPNEPPDNISKPSDQVVMVSIETWQEIRDMMNGWVFEAPTAEWSENRRQEVLVVLNSLTIYRRSIPASEKAA